jgi:Bacterial Ig domain
VTPTANERFSNSMLTIAGDASDNVGVGLVRYSLNGGGWNPASMVNDSWTHWTANVTLMPGTNTIQVYAVDTSGNISATRSVNVVLVETP